MRVLRTLLLGLILIPSAGAVHAQGYLFQPGDVIEVTVIEDPNLNRRVLIAPDGQVSLPLAGSVRAGGRTVGQVQAAVRRALASSFVTSPNVTVSLVALAPPPLPEAPEEVVEEEIPLWTVYVLGEVRRPGSYTYESDKRINALQALALAGGPDAFAARERIQIRRVTDSVEQIEILDYDAIEEGRSLSRPAPLADGDVIVVPERGLFD